MARGRELGEARVHVAPDRRIGSGGAAQGDADEDPIVVVGSARREGLAVHRHHANPVLAGRFGDQLLNPRPEGGKLAVDDKGQLVAAVGRKDAHGQPQGQAGIAGRVGDAASHDHRPGALEEPLQRDAQQGAGHKADVRQGRVSAADVRRV